MLWAIEDEILTIQTREERLDLARRHPRRIIFGVALVLGA